MFNTTCRVNANGYMVQTFIQEDLSKICEELQSNTSCSQLNDKIKQMCMFTLDQINNPQNGQAKAIVLVKPILNTAVQSNVTAGNRVNVIDKGTMKTSSVHIQNRIHN